MAEPPIDVSLVHPFDPWHQGISGFDTFLDGFLRYAPPRWRIELIGVTCDPVARPVGRRTVAPFDGRRLEIVPVLCDPEPDAAGGLPLSLRFALWARLRRARPRGAIVQFHRFESVFAVPRRGEGRRTLFLHNHPPELVSPQSDVRWRGHPRLFEHVLQASLARVEAAWGVDLRTPEWVATFAPRLAGDAFWQPVWADSADFAAGTPAERERDRVALRDRLGLEAGDRLLVFAGRLESQKNPLLLVDTLARIAARRPRLFLLIVGRGRLRRAIERRAAGLGIHSRLRWLDGEARPQLAPIYRGCDVSLCCSAYESGPRSVYESLACGCPAVSFDIGQVREALEPLSDLGLLVEEPSVPALARAVERALAAVAHPGLAGRCAAAVADATPQRGLAPLFDRYTGWLEEHERAVRSRRR